MSHVCGRSSSGKSNLFSKHSKATDKKCCCVTTLTGNSTYFNREKDKKHNIRRLKTRKERCQRRDERKNKSHHCCCESRKDLTIAPNYYHSCHVPSRKNPPILSTVAVTQEPSIITDSRLIGHHGLFNHEVKSIDIERLLSETKSKEGNSNTLNISSSPSDPNLLSSAGLVGADAEEVEPVENKPNTAANTQETESMKLHFSNPNENLTPGQRLQQQPYSFSESPKNINQSKSCFQATKTKNAAMDQATQVEDFNQSDEMRTLNRTSHGNMISDPKQPDNNQDCQVQADYLRSSLTPHPPSLSAGSFDQQHLNPDPALVLKITHAVAARLCECLHLPPSNRRNLLTETKEALLKSLQERHGPFLQANLQEVQRSLKFLNEPAQARTEQEPHMMEEDEPLSTDAFVKIPGSESFFWKSSPQSHDSLQQIPEEMVNPVDTFVNLWDESFRPGSSPHLYMDFKHSATSVSDLFADSPLLTQRKNISEPVLWDNRFRTQESALLDQFQNNFMNHTTDPEERVFEQHPHRSNVQPFISHLDGHSANLQNFPPELKPCETDRFHFAPFFASKRRNHNQSNHLQALGQVSPFYPNFRPNSTDMINYPPSHMLERTLAPPSSSLPSPERWSFPPMRLY